MTHQIHDILQQVGLSNYHPLQAVVVRINDVDVQLVCGG
jgi:hypothetical protein